MPRRGVTPAEVVPCVECGHVIVLADNGWQHIRVGVTVSGAFACGHGPLARPVHATLPNLDDGRRSA